MKKIVLFIWFALMVASVSAQWSNNSKENVLISAVGESGNSMTKTVKTSDDMMYVSYTTGEVKFYTKLQLVDKDGKCMWPNGGVLISNHLSATWTTDYSLCVTPDDCAVLTFSDSRNDPDGGSFQPFVYKVNKAGELVWGVDGIKIPYENFAAVRPRMCVTKAGNVIVGFTDIESNQVVFTKLSADGQVIWSELTVKLAAMVNFVPSGADGFILTYYINNGSSAKLYAERYNANGEPVWGAPVAIDDSGLIAGRNEPYILSDGADGVIALYGVYVDISEFYVMMQRVSADGDLLMGLGGTKCSDTYDTHSSGRFDVDVEKGEIFIIETCNLGSDSKSLIVNKFNMFGETIWDSQGVVFPKENTFYGCITQGVSHTGDGGAILIYIKNVSALKQELMTARVGADGIFKWQDIPLSDVDSKKTRIAYSPFFNNQVCVFWEDGRGGGSIYGQNISDEGKLGVITVGVNDLMSNTLVSVYPNPAKDLISIKCESGSVENVIITDLSGRVIMNVSSYFDGIDVRALKSGVYVVNTITSEGSFVNKVVIK